MNKTILGIPKIIILFVVVIVAPILAGQYLSYKDTTKQLEQLQGVCITIRPTPAVKVALTPTPTATPSPTLKPVIRYAPVASPSSK